MNRRPAGGSKSWPLPEGVRGRAVFSENGDYRYMLERDWSTPIEPMSTIGFIGLNPSTAEATLDDPTVRKCWHWAKREGFNRFWMLNVFAYRATSPAEMRAQSNPVGSENYKWLRTAAVVCDRIVCAWGAGVKPENAARVISALRDGQLSRFHCLGLTKDGHPKHPLYLANATEVVEWWVE